MGDFRTQFVTKVLPTNAGTAVAQAPADWTALANFDRAFLMPACAPSTTAGIGRTSGTLSNTLLQITADAAIDDIDSITFSEGFNAGIVRDNRAGAWLTEYLGPPSGPSAIISRGDFTITLGSGVTTADSAAIADISDFAKCAVRGTAKCDHNSNDYRSHIPEIDLVDTGTTYVVRVTRSIASGTMTVRARVIECTGSLWGVQKVIHTFVASNTDEDETVTAADPAHTLILSTMRATGTTPAQQGYFVYLANGTTLRHRIKTKPSTSPRTVSFLLTHPLLSVARYGTPDGTSDFTATGSSPESFSVTITAVPDLTQALVWGHVAVDTTDTANIPCALAMFDFTDTTHGRIRRSQSFGNFEAVLHVADFSQIVSARIDTVTPIQDGESFTITGIFGSSPTVTHGGDAVTVDSANATTIVCAASLGTKKYGTSYALIVADAEGGVVSSEQVIEPQDGIFYANLAAPLIGAAQRSTAVADLEGTEQVEWDEEDVQFFSNGAFRYLPGVTSFNNRFNDGTGWGTSALQTLQLPLVAPVLNGTIPDFQIIVGVPTQLNFGNFATSWTVVALVGSLPSGMTFDFEGLLSGTPGIIGDYSFVTRYSNEVGSVDSNTFHVRVIGLPQIVGGSPPSISFNIALGSRQIDFKPYFTGAVSYGISPALPTGWSFVNGVLSIVPGVAALSGPFTVSATNTVGTVSLTPFTVEILPAFVPPPNLSLNQRPATTLRQFLLS